MTATDDRGIETTGPRGRRRRAGRGPQPEAPDRSLLPPAPGVARRERRRRRAVRRRRYVVAPVVLLVLVALAVLGAQLRSSPSHRRSAARVPAVAPPPAAAPGVPSLLLAHRAANGRVDLATVVGVAAGGHNASVVLVPTLTAAETPSFDPQLIADLLNLGPTQLLQTTVENLMGVRIDQTAVLDDATLSALMQAAGPLSVRLRDPVPVLNDPQGRVYPAGDQELAPQDATTLLTTTVSTGELDHLVAVQAVFEGWLRALRSPQAATLSTTRVPQLASLVAAAQASTTFSTLPVTNLGGQGDERYQVRTDALGPAMQTAFPGRLLGIGGRRPRVEILDGTGVPGLAQQVAAVVVPAGGDVVKTGNAQQFGQASTQVVYYRDSARAQAESLLAALGAGTVLKEPTDIGVFDITVIAGADFKSPPGT